MAELTNDLVWSHSRARLFSECKRAYWFAYYGSWGGWKPEAPAETKAAYVQKKLTSIPMWTGSRVHGAAELVLRRVAEGYELPTVHEVVATTAAEVKRDVRESADGSWLKRPAKKVGFREHFYQEEVEPGAFDAAGAEIERQVRALYENKVFRRLLDVPGRIVEVEELKQFAVGNAQVWVSLDVLVDDGHGGAVVIDWKTGSHHDEGDIASQLGVYGLYAVSAYGYEETRVQARHVNLRLDTVTRHAAGPAEMQAAREEIARSIGEMRALLVDVPGNVAQKEDFPELPPGSDRCTHCSVRRVCGRA